VRNPAVPPALSDLILRLLARDPAGRPASAGATAEALQAMQGEETTPVFQPAPPPRPLPTGARGGKRRRGPGAWLAAGAAAVVIVICGAVAIHIWTARAPADVHAAAPPPSDPSPVPDKPPPDDPPRSGKPPAPSSVDLLDRIDLKKDVAGGHWDKKDSVLIADKDFSYVTFKYSPPLEYRLELTVEREAANQDLPLYIGFPIKGYGTAVVLVDERTRGSPSNTMIYQDYWATNQDPAPFHEGLLLRTKSPAQLAIEVRDKDVRFRCNDQLLLHWKGDVKWITKVDTWQIPDETVRDLGWKRVPFLGCTVPMRISKLTATPLGKGE
jgi:hypothetical protein